ncbi:MAG: hypothetical protein L0196_04635 [candidate division Zixibacteria bacterium]|nr:hypothetical protein [candidate division Zixibacteria bacterium]
MNTVTEQKVGGKEATLVRLGGLAGLLMLGLYVAINFILTEGPPASGSPEEIKAYISNQAGAMAIANGLRYLALFCAAFIAVGLYTLTGRGAPLTGNGWGIVGLLGAAALMATGVVSNTIRTMAFLNLSNLSEQPEHFMLQWNLSGVLFRVAQLFSGMMIAGFSIAGWQSATIPKWLTAAGLLFAASGLLTAVCIAWTMTDSRAWYLLMWTRDILGLVWFLGASIQMLRRASA